MNATATTADDRRLTFAGGVTLGPWDTVPMGALVIGCLVAITAAIALSGFDLNANRLILALCFGLLVPFLVHQSRHFGLLSPGFLLGLSFIYFNLINPLEAEINTSLPASFYSIMPWVDRAHLTRPLVATLFGAVGLLLGYGLGVAPHPGRSQSHWELPGDPARLRRGGWWLVGVGGAMYFAGITQATGSPIGFYTVSYLERVELMPSVGVLGNGLALLYVGAMIVVAGYFGDRACTRRLPAFILVVAFGLHSVLAGAKVHIFIVGVAALAAHQLCRHRAQQLRGSTLGLMAAVALVAGLMIAINPMRARLGLGLGEMAEFAKSEFDPQYLNPANVDAMGPYATLYAVANDTVLVGPEYGKSYWNAILHLPPGWLLPDRWPGLHDRFADKMLEANAPAVAGFAFSAVAEGYLNFGFLGAALHLALLGWLAGAASRVLRVNRGNLRGVIVAAFAGPWLAMSIRMNSDTALRETVAFMLVPLLVNDWLTVKGAAARPPD
jgi:hypothetical protein